MDVHLNELKEKNSFLPDPGLEAPTPVFFCTIETYSEMTQKQLDVALKNIRREDPSLRVRIDDQTGQTILLGMGELHIDIIRDRLKREYGLETYLGPLNVNYRETPRRAHQQRIVWNSNINERHATISIAMSIEPIVGNEKKVISFSEIQIVRNDEQNFEHLRKEHVGKNEMIGCSHRWSMLYYCRSDQSWCSSCSFHRFVSFQMILFHWILFLFRMHQRC